MEFSCLGSGSKGNATLVRFEDQLVMVDCGFSLKYIHQALSAKGCSADELTAVLVTHEHGDHIKGVNTLAKRLNLPVYCTAGTFRSGKLSADLDINIITGGISLQLGNLVITAVTVPHDAREPCQFHFSANNKKLGVLTDLGSFSEHVVDAYRDCHAILLEANHDVDMLMQGPYPASLKRRVVGDWGHLSNDQALNFLNDVNLQDVSTLVLGHISEKNNTLDLVKKLFGHFDQHIDNVIYASQNEGFHWQKV